MPRSPEERQANALEDISKGVKALVKLADTQNSNIVYIGLELAKSRERASASHEALITEAAATMVEAKTRIPVRTFPSADDKTPVGWAEIDSNGWIDIQIPGANLVNDLEFLTELGNIKALYISVEFGSATMNEEGDTNAAE